MCGVINILVGALLLNGLLAGLNSLPQGWVCPLQIVGTFLHTLPLEDTRVYWGPISR